MVKTIAQNFNEVISAMALFFSAAAAFIGKRNRDDIKPTKAITAKVRRRAPRRREIDKVPSVSLADLSLRILDEVNLVHRRLDEHGAQGPAWHHTRTEEEP